MKHGGVSSIKFRDIAQDYFVQNNHILFSYERVQDLNFIYNRRGYG